MSALKYIATTILHAIERNKYVRSFIANRQILLKDIEAITCFFNIYIIIIKAKGSTHLACLRYFLNLQ